MTQLLALIRDEIAANGPISVARYMELALQHPVHGYYRQRNPLGAEGDFVTAPDISQMFGELIGLWCADVWRQMGKPDDFLLLELGPGRGTLMQDALRATAKIAGFHQASHLWLLESDAPLIAEQKKRLAAHDPVHCADLTQLPALPLLVVANEFFDALPIRQFMKTGAEWRERMVANQDGGLAFVEGEAVDAPEVSDTSATSFLESSPLSLAFMQKLATHIARHGGAGLFIDYGYVAPNGGSTLQAVARHAYAPVLERPGEVDLTAHVDFTALRQMAEWSGARAWGPVGQGAFLESLGIELRAAQLNHNATPEQAEAIRASVHRLTDSSQMGVLFKVLGIASPALQVAGFP